MNKAELIGHIAREADLSKMSAARALEAVLGAVTAVLADGGTVALAGFGSFEVGERAARQGRNPRSGEVLTIEAAKVVKFRAGKNLKDALK
jgi:DNA-binding protein HU-beta